ncbi:AI-2E family transporter [Truepera radiovictrix]|uniref:AI-2E family transporter n=1 Tax=Truepera radiovictrix (strain DSM 17093 / CIP 108686 / LMG 22925 / RQ-24) TaxID=649638 RepID=D7CWJ0_TRURR|nr:AI-2E family transporter [Truepera radiovictrix]ADI14389.1 protein of unknown function UPF0118 [Truepera radiovictrix DSM 17093]WMT57054.1 AI-2E family transporter [Truepera radiovictrix]
MVHATLAELWRSPYVRLACLLLLASGAVWFFYETRGVWLLFFLAYTIAYLTNPLTLWFQRRRLPRWLGVGVVLLLLTALFALASFVIAQFVHQASLFMQELPNLNEPLLRWYEGLPEVLRGLVPTPVVDFLGQPGAQAGAELGAELIAPFEGMVGYLGGVLTQFSANVFALLVNFVGGLLQAVVLLFLTLFLLYDFNGINRTFLRLIPERYREGGLETLQRLDVSVGGYIRGQILIALVVGFSIWLGLTLLGVPLAFGVGFVAAVFNVVPFLGPIVAFIPAGLLALTVGWPYVLATAALFMVINFLDGNVISPIIFSKTVKVHPLTVILSVALGASLLGLLGAVLAVPTAAFVKVLYQEYYLTSRWYQRERYSALRADPPAPLTLEAQAPRATPAPGKRA